MPTLRIGVIGHRTVDDPSAAADEVRRALVLARSAGPGDHAIGAPVRLEVYSALAEGADRLAAGVLLDVPGATLVAVLPMATDDYLSDFPSPESKAAFLALLDRAARVEVVGPTRSRVEGYERAGRRIVDACDAVIALWDGEPSRGRGGTAEIVAYARGSGVPVFWIGTNRGTVSLRRI
jgi:hypothetical protein